MSEIKILSENLKTISDETILSILAYIAQHQDEKITLMDIVGFVGMSPSTIRDKYLKALCKEGLVQKYYLRNETESFRLNKTKLGEIFRLMKLIINP